ncbi:hypothetical protein PVK06_031179 [Gossypium arboreum]|uniref:RNase H type-1 domain-containing protein n=1 Tax=Gossypium arboreum TaxID=29729 RepID=A0ABR0NQC1_GOSAR|nr:hypothetical protein PVK06_031179 [Gossypium arboreum]
MLLKMGFSVNWVERMMRFITLVTYSVVVNERVGDKLTPSRGLWQRDPLSSYLFLACSEGLSALLRLAKSSGAIKGARVVRGAPRVTHLLFADDSLIFGYTMEMEASSVLKSTMLLSMGDMEVFIKSILQVVPTYAMMFFLLPRTFSKEIEAADLLFIAADAILIQVKGDSRSIIGKINNHEQDFSDISALTWSAKEIAKEFQAYAFHFIGESENKTVHAMAQ